jgi:uncharacterized protein (TIGR02246 family)
MPANHPHELHELFIAAINAKDPDALLALYEQEGTAVDLDGKEHTGEPAMRAMFSGLLIAINHIDGTTRKVYVAGDVALTSATWRAEVAAPDGTVHHAGGTTAEIARRQPDGTWRFVIDDPQFT